MFRASLKMALNSALVSHTHTQAHINTLTHAHSRPVKAARRKTANATISKTSLYVC